MIKLQHLAVRQLATYVLLLSGAKNFAIAQQHRGSEEITTGDVVVAMQNGDLGDVVANAQPEDQAADQVSATIAPVTVVSSNDGGLMTATYTPTSFGISGLAPPITAATTITTTDEAGKNIAIAIAAGAGVVAGGALAAWLFEPMPNAPPAPTTPPPYSTEEQPDKPTDVSDDPSKSTSSSSSSSSAGCPFPTNDGNIKFKTQSPQPEWTFEFTSRTTSSFSPKCTPSREIDGMAQMLRGTDPAYINELAAVFCKNDLSKDIVKQVNRDDLPDDSAWKSRDGLELGAEFSFKFKKQIEGCAEYCVKAFKDLVSKCQHNSHYLYGMGSLEQGCGTYSLQVKGEPITNLECSGSRDNPLDLYMYRGAAMDAIKNFCTAQDGVVVKRGDQESFVKELVFSVSYTDHCVGSGEYTIEKETCIRYLNRLVDDCDTDTILYKHGGSLEDEDNCGRFEFHPKNFENVSCWPQNEKDAYISGGEHVPISHDIAVDAINAFCDRSGDGQQYTLDPKVKPDPSNFIQNTCKESGMADCNYLYLNNGKRVENEGDIVVRFSATHVNPSGFYHCDPDQVYEIHGERCKAMLGKFTGDDSVKRCADDKDKLDLGSIVEVGEKGCVLWNMWAVKGQR